jgi:hypothetical protein
MTQTQRHVAAVILALWKDTSLSAMPLPQKARFIREAGKRAEYVLSGRRWFDREWFNRETHNES